MSNRNQLYPSISSTTEAVNAIRNEMSSSAVRDEEDYRYENEGSDFGHHHSPLEIAVANNLGFNGGFSIRKSPNGTRLKNF